VQIRNIDELRHHGAGGRPPVRCCPGHRQRRGQRGWGADHHRRSGTDQL